MNERLNPIAELPQSWQAHITERALLRGRYIALESKSFIKDERYKSGKRNGRIRDMWDSLNKRCRPSFWTKRPTYTGTINGFTGYTEFVETISKLMHKADLISLEGFELDKDLLSIGGKTYSPSTVMLLPRVINFALAKLTPSSKNNTGEAGLSYRHNKNTTSYIVKTRKSDGKQVNKTFASLEDAKSFYLEIASLRWKGYMATYGESIKSQSVVAYQFLKKLSQPYSLGVTMCEFTK
ncbi:hypothetical protein [Shewanella halifaxensis]|uniref:hypothetical protein n=1 Tax=Shewanella halifaxensis TaxID=271098 RepID=UPI000D5982FD|nr:hypothetical protein [Shewanella halifaxensis]